MHIEKKLFTNYNLINVLIALVPLSLILGNLIVNLNVILICLVGITIYKLDTFKISKKIYQYLIYAFFCYLILITLISYLPLITSNSNKIFPNNISSKESYIENIFKVFFFLRFLILFFVITKLIEENHFNEKFFFISCAFFSCVVAIDIFIQVSFGRNLLGNTYEYRPTSFFNDEDIAGGFLQKFSLFFIFFISFINISKNKKNYYIYLTFLAFFILVVLINNRMPVLLFTSSFFIFLFLNKNFKAMVFAVLFILSILTTLNVLSEKLSSSYSSFYANVKQILVTAPGLFYNSKAEGEVWYNFTPETLKAAGMSFNKEIIPFAHGYTILFNSGIQLWKENKIFGQGLKSFKFNCSRGKNTTCSTHPHNYFIEIALDTGLIGLILIYSIFFLSIFDFMKFNKNNLDFNSKLMSFPFFLIIFFEFFPLRGSGSFFSTSNASIIFLMLPILIGLSNSKKN